MQAWLAARSDPGHYGEMVAVEFPNDTSVLGPGQAQARIEQESEVSSYITLRDQAGSDVIRGNLIIIPIERSVLYVEPLFIESPQAQIPELDQVVVVMGDQVVMQPTLSEALAVVLGAAPPGEEPPGEEPPGEEPPGEEPPEETTVEELILQAQAAFAAADEALREGELATYQAQVDRAERLLARVARELGLEPSETPSPSQSPAAPSTAVPTEDVTATVEPTAQPERSGG